jgi:hypothetical protein
MDHAKLNETCDVFAEIPGAFLQFCMKDAMMQIALRPASRESTGGEE